MDYQLQVKPFKRKDGYKYKIIEITDIALHTTNMEATSSGKKIKQAFQKNAPGKLYSPIYNQDKHENATLTLLKSDPEFMQFIQDEEAKGYKILLSVPKKGIPIVPGKDTVEFMKSRKGKRILRKLERKRTME